MPENTLTRHAMKMQKAIAFTIIPIGLLTLIAGLFSWIVGAFSPFNSTMIIILGVLLLVVGMSVLIREMFESWLSRSQAALVDGLQAG